MAAPALPLAPPALPAASQCQVELAPSPRDTVEETGRSWWLRQPIRPLVMSVTGDVDNLWIIYGSSMENL